MLTIIEKINNFLTEASGSKLDSKEIKIILDLVNKNIDMLGKETLSRQLYDALSHQRSGAQITTIVDSIVEELKGAAVNAVRSVILN